jgi:hypothetical protein
MSEEAKQEPTSPSSELAGNADLAKKFNVCLQRNMDGGEKDIKTMAQTLHKDLHSLITNFKDSNPQHAEVASMKEPSIFDQLETVVKNGGAFESDSAVARRFYSDLKKDPALKKAKNDACRGNGKEALLAFREKWAGTKLTQVNQSRSKIAEVVDLVSLNAEYCTLDRIWTREGGTEPAWETSLTFVKSALAKFQAGEGFHGHPFLKYCDMRRTTMVR